MQNEPQSSANTQECSAESRVLQKAKLVEKMAGLAAGQRKRGYGPWPRTDEERELRFWSHVKINPDGCWLWTGSKVNGNYGMVRFNGKQHLTHRLSWILTFGAIPKGLNCLHKCDVPNCVRPDHLFIGTALDNVKDMWAKGRAKIPNSEQKAKGESVGNSKLTAIEVEKLRALASTGQYYDRQLAKLFGISCGNVHCIRTRRTWKHLK